MTTYDKSRAGLKITEVGTPDPALLRQWAEAPENTTCWGLDRVADELERLSLSLSEASRPTWPWIPVSVRPEKRGTYLASWRGTFDPKPRVHAAYYEGGDEWSLNDTALNVTHWMPLPEAPK